MLNTILAKRVNHIVAKGDHPVWPKGSKSHGFSMTQCPVLQRQPPFGKDALTGGEVNHLPVHRDSGEDRSSAVCLALALLDDEDDREGRVRLLHFTFCHVVVL